MIAESPFFDLGLPITPIAILCWSPLHSAELRRVLALIAAAKKEGR